MSTCKGCHKEIVWGVTDTGAKIPLDPRAAVYAPVGEPEPNFLQPIIRLNKDEAMVTHFVTCPNASKFSGRNREDSQK